MKYIILLLISVLSHPALVSAGCGTIPSQDVVSDTVSCLLIDAAKENKAVNGVKFSVKNKKTEKKTNKMGLVQLLGVNENDTLLVMFSKKEIVEIPVEGRKYLKIVVEGKQLSEVEIAEEEINVLLKQIELQKKSSDGTITGEQLRAAGATNLFTALSGRVAGLQIRGDGVSMRGSTSMKSGNNEPVYVLDGTIVPFQTLDAVNIQDVKSVKVLKEATKYGSRGANGAIEVYTK